MTIKYYELAPIDTEVEIGYRDALLYCSFLTANNHSDWRLPTEPELSSIVKNQHQDFKTDFYWVVGGYMFIEDNNNSVLIDGFTSMNDQSSITNRVRAIRDNPDYKPSIVNRIKYWFKNQIILNPFTPIDNNDRFDTLFFNELWRKYRNLH